MGIFDKVVNYIEDKEGPWLMYAWSLNITCEVYVQGRNQMRIYVDMHLNVEHEVDGKFKFNPTHLLKLDLDSMSGLSLFI